MPQSIRRLIVIWGFLLNLITLTPSYGAVPAQGLYREVWNNIGGGNLLSDLTNNALFPNSPTSSNYITAFEVPVNVFENYGQRVRGWIFPPETGDYVFWFSSDDQGALFLSVDGDPAHKTMISFVNSWTNPREWTREGNQQSAPIRLEVGQSYYIEGMMKEGGGGDNMAVKWQLPNTTQEEPIPASRMRPFGTAMTGPQISLQPTNITLIEGSFASFDVRVTNIGPMSYRWQRQQANVTGATNPSYLRGPVTLADNNTTYRCLLSNSVSTLFSTEVTLTVLADSTPPQLSSALNASSQTVAVIFNEPVEASTGTAPGNYQISGGLAVNGAAFGADTRTIILTLNGPMTYNTQYTITVNTVRDRSSTPNTIAANSQVSFTAVEYVPANIGNPPASGSATYVAGGFNVTASGNDIGGTADQFHFDYQPRTGNFDIKVRVQNLAGLDMFTEAGLMARETLEANSRFSGAFATPSLSGAFGLARTTGGGTTAKGGYAPVNYPDTWLRIVRSGNNFTNYASIDGSTWVFLSSASITMPSTILVGTALASRSDTQTATAQFRDLGVATGGNFVTSLTVKGEPLAASSRRTGLIISEIMYHPPDRADGKNLEFVELFNTDPVAENLSGFRIEGAFNYTFPQGTILPSGNFLVVAKDSAAIQSVYGINNVIGGFPGTLSNDSEVIRVYRKSGALILEAHYSDKTGWPLAADGAGHSLVLARPSFGEAQREAWAASALKGGSPGRGEPIRSDIYESLVINEILAHTDDPLLDYIEIYNHSNAAVSLQNCFLTDDRNTNKFQFINNVTVPARSSIVVDQAQLGFALDAGGETIFLIAPNNTRVIDAVRFEGQENGVSFGRYPDGSSRWTALQSRTPGTSNTAPVLRDIVINEIMYHPISDLDEDEYVELYNNGTSTVNLSGWRFTDAIDFTFPTNTTLAPNAYMVVAKDLVNLRSKYAQLNAANSVGDYDGTLSNSGERLALSMPDEVVGTNELGVLTTNIIYIVMAEVEYGEGGRWGKWADGGGSSLELINPRADMMQSSSWADSNEELKSTWTTIQFTGVLDNGNGNYPANQFQMHLQGMGECLVDDVEVISGAANQIANPGFESDLTGWVVQGAFKNSFVEAGRGINSTKALHVVTPVRGDTGANRVYYNLPATIASGNTATLRAKVRWLKGYPEFLMRFRGNWLEAYGRLNLPTNLGSPGQPNSRAISNAGPAIYEVVHDPILPAANQAVVITARATDSDGVNAPQLKYRLDASATYTTVTMNDGGTAGDAIANDGIWSGTIPGQSSGLVAFYVQATDRAGAPVTTTFPSDAPNTTCLVRWGETQQPGTIATYRLWMSQATINAWSSRHVLDNAPLDVTFVYGNSRVVYNVGALYSGSPFHAGYNGPTGGICDYVVNFREDELFLGATDFVLNSVGNLDNDDSAQREQAAFWIAKEMDLPFNHRRHVHMFVNGQRRGKVYEDAQQPNAHFVEGWFPDDTDGELLKIEDWFEFNDGANSFANVDANLGFYTTTGGALKQARYRWGWRPRAVKRSANDYVNFLELVRAVNDQTTAYTTRVENTADIEEWMRIFCVEHIVGNWDSYGYNRGKNMFTYRPRNGKWTMMAWDIDFVLGSGSDGTETGMFGANDGNVGRMYNHPPFRRAYFRAMLDAVNGPLAPQNVEPVLDARYDVLIANGVNVPAVTPIKSWIAARRTYLQGQLAGVAANFAITSNNGNNFSTNKNFITISGAAPVSVKTIEVNGAPYPVTWTSVTGWSINVALPNASNLLNLRGYDLAGNEVAGAVDSITISYTGALTSPAGFVVINEIMYNPFTTNASFIELANNSSTSAFDLSGFRLEGADFTFPQGTVIGPTNYLVVAKSAAFFAAAYGSSIPVAGEFQGSLDNGGERLKLVKPGATPAEDELIDVVRYDDDPPWPVAADGTGPSLQLIDPSKDNSIAGNWTAATGATKYTPGAVNNVKATLAAFPTLWINEILPNNTNSITDGAGDRDPWIEIYNSGASAINLSSYYLTDDYNALTKWQFPSFTLNPGQFLIVWTDGEPGESAPGAPHTSFRMAPATGSIALVRMQGSPSQAAVIDFINYNQISPNRSYGSYPDGQNFDRQLFHFLTPQLANDNTSLVIPVTINEWMASNTRTLADPADGQFEDWFELYNSGNVPVDLSGYYLTDVLTNKTKWRIPPGYVIQPQGYLLVWADEEQSQNLPTRIDLHAEIKLSASGEEIGLFGADGTQIDAIVFGAQTDDVSEGRFPDAGAAPYFKMPQPTPRASNLIPSGNRPPTLAAIPDATISEELEFQIQPVASDPDAGQTLTYTLIGGAPGATIDANSGLFRWTPTEDQGPGNYSMTIRVTDNGTPALSRSDDFTLNVNEANRAPQLGSLPDITIDEQFAFGFTVAAADPDLPAQPLQFFLDEGPAGASINGNNGRFDWTPLETDGPGVYPVTIRVRDVGTPQRSDSKRFFITVRDVNSPPSLTTIPDQFVFQGDTLTIDPAASDSDIPAQTLSFSLEGITGPQFNTANGHFVWTPTTSSTNVVTIRVTDSGSPTLNTPRSFTIVVGKTNRPPTFTSVGTQTVVEDTDFSLQLASNPGDVGQTNTYVLLTSISRFNVSPTGLINWHPTEAQGPSTNNIQIRITDNGESPLSVTQTVSIVVTEINLAPVFGNLPDITIDEQVAYTLNVPVTDPDLPAQTLQYFMDENPPGATLNSTGRFDWTPTEAQGPGSYPVTFRVVDNGSPPRSATNRFTITVREVNLAPTLAFIPDQIVIVGETLTINPVASDSDLPAQTLTFTSQGLAGAQINPTSGQFTWTPTLADAPSTNSVTIRVTDSGNPSQSTPRTFTVIAGRTNKVPTFTSVPTQTIVEETDFSLQLASDPGDAGQTNTYALEIPISGLVVSPTGLITWRPTEAQGPSTNTIQIRITDNGDPARSITPAITIVVTETNLPPVFGSLPNITIDEQIAFTLNVPASDPDLPSQTLQYFMDENPPGATLNSTGRFDWTPTEAQGPGSYPVTFRVVDNGAPARSATNRFTITVREVNLPPTLALIADQTVIEGDTLIIDPVASDSDLPAQTLTFSVEGLNGAQINPNTGRLTWTPGAGDVPATNQVTIRVTDSGTPAASTPRTFTVVAGKSNRAPTFAPLPIQTAPEEALWTLQLLADPGAGDTGQTNTFALETPISGLTLSSGGLLSWQPTEDQGPSTNEIRFRITDNGVPARSIIASITNVINEVNRAPVLPTFPQQNATVDEPFTLGITATDPDRPTNSLTYSLNPGAPAGMAIHPTTGQLTWTPDDSFLNTTTNISVRVTDNGSPNLSDDETISIRVNPPVVWRFASASGTASTSTLYVYLEAAGQVIIDDLRLVAGTNAAVGPNLLPNGDFESPLSPPWVVSPNHTGSFRTNVAKSGSFGLNIVASTGGTTRASSIYQDIAPTLTTNAPYTLSYWFIPSTTTSNTLRVRLSLNGINFAQSTFETAEPPPTIDITATALQTGEMQLVWPSRPGLNYRIFYRADLDTAPWQQLTDVNSTGTTAGIRLPFSAANARFIKIQYLP